MIINSRNKIDEEYKEKMMERQDKKGKTDKDDEAEQ
jgi:hypothetical protein